MPSFFLFFFFFFFFRVGSWFVGLSLYSLFFVVFLFFVFFFCLGCGGGVCIFVFRSFLVVCGFFFFFFVFFFWCPSLVVVVFFWCFFFFFFFFFFFGLFFFLFCFLCCKPTSFLAFRLPFPSLYFSFLSLLRSVRQSSVPITSFFFKRTATVVATECADPPLSTWPSMRGVP